MMKPTEKLQHFIDECAFAKVVSTSKGDALLIGGQVIQFAEGESEAVDMLSIALRRLARGEVKLQHCRGAGCFYNLPTGEIDALLKQRSDHFQAMHDSRSIPHSQKSGSPIPYPEGEQIGALRNVPLNGKPEIPSVDGVHAVGSLIGEHVL